MRYQVSDGEITVFISAANDGKFRFKTRLGRFNFGEGFATRQKPFVKTAYLEWQIGYDATESELRSGKKKTRLNHIKFVGANRKKKSPFELSELIFQAAKTGIIRKADLKKLLDQVESISDFISQRQITVSSPTHTTIADISFHEAITSLPTFFAEESADGTQIEVSVEKQQHASGVQPMLYFCIPLGSFANGGSILGRATTVGDELEYVINEANAQMLLLAFRVFGSCSPAHKHDVCEILKLLMNEL